MSTRIGRPPPVLALAAGQEVTATSVRLRSQGPGVG